MTDTLTAIDHLLVGVRDLDTAGRAYERLGFTLTPLGRHVGKESGNYCIMFGDDYLELKGIVDPSLPSEGFAEQLDRRGEGWIGVAFAGAADQDAADGWRGRGVEASNPLELARMVELSEGDTELRFTRVRLPETAQLGLDAFVCQHLTPESARRPEWLEHENGAVGIAGVTAVVDEPHAFRAFAEKLVGHAAVRDSDFDLVLSVGAAEIRLAARSEWRDPSRDLPPGPFIANAAVSVRNPAATARFLAARGVGIDVTPSGAVRVPRAEACGATLDFVEVPT